MQSSEAWVSAAARAGLFVFGIVMALLGAALPSLAGQLRFAMADIGTLFVAMNSAMLATNLGLGLAMDRFGMKPPLAGGPLLVAGALALMARASHFADLFPAAVLLGIGGAAVNGAANTLVADLHEDPKRKASALNLLGVFFGFGALLLPFAIGALVASFGIAALLLACSALCVAAGLFASLLVFPPPKQPQRLPVADMPRFLRSGLVLAAAALLFFQSGVEFTMGGYVGPFLTMDLQWAAAAASWVVAAYWAAIMGARVALSRIALRASPSVLVAACAITASAGAALTAIAGGGAGAVAGIVITGLALSGVYPAVLAVMGAAFREHSGTVFGILFTAGLAGGMIVPWAAGQFAAAYGGWAVFWMVASAFAVIAVLSRAMRRAHV